MTELAGYTARVDEMFLVFEDMKNEKYQRNVVTTTDEISDMQNIDGPLQINGTSIYNKYNEVLL